MVDRRIKQGWREVENKRRQIVALELQMESALFHKDDAHFSKCAKEHAQALIEYRLMVEEEK